MLPDALALHRFAVPVIGAPLFIISQPDLVIAQCKAGVIGAFPSLNARPEPVLEEWLERIARELAEHDAAHPERPSAPFAVNLIVHKSNPRLMHDLEVCVKHRVKIVITSLGARPEVNEAIHSYGGVVLHDIINVAFARKAIEKGADGLIAVAAGAGGHAGTWSPFALVEEIRAWFDGPLALSGAIARQRSAAQEVQRGLFLIGARADVAEARGLSDENAFGGMAKIGSADGSSLRTPSDSPKLRDIAGTLVERMRLIKDDEHEGVRHEVGATNGC